MWKIRICSVFLLLCVLLAIPLQVNAAGSISELSTTSVVPKNLRPDNEPATSPTFPPLETIETIDYSEYEEYKRMMDELAQIQEGFQSSQSSTSSKPINSTSYDQTYPSLDSAILFVSIFFNLLFLCLFLDIRKRLDKAQSELARYKRLNPYSAERMEAADERFEILKSNLRALPYMARIIADFDTRELDFLAQDLDWGRDRQRLKKVASLQALRKETRSQIEKYKTAEYQLAYAMEMFPALEDFLCVEYEQLPQLNLSNVSAADHDYVRDYLSKEEYAQLPSVERNQLALDRYFCSHKKTNWQIGRDYELYVGYAYTKKGYSVDYCGSYNGLEDLGRDLIASLEDRTLIIQCKYWSSKKLIHEKHINQLYGTMVCYCFEKNIPAANVYGVLVTNITASDTAKRFAQYLGITIVENFALGNYPCIKCNINRSSDGRLTKIYHLPFDQQYDSCKINQPGEFFAATVAEAENAGFRRAFRWHS